MTHVRPATEREWPEAVRLLTRHLAATVSRGRSAAVTQLLTTREIDPAGLLVALDGSSLVDALLTQRPPGRIGSVLLPAGPARRALLHAALERFRADGIASVQCLVPPPEARWADVLWEFGFASPSDLIGLTRLTPTRPAVRPGLGLVPFSGQPFASVLGYAKACFCDSLDFPELNADRPVADWLAAHRPAWDAGGHLAVLGGAVVGLGIVSATPGGAELHYLGLVPAARGRGLGGPLLGLLLGKTSGLVTTSVDARNAPARKVYGRAGFIETSRRTVYMWGDRR